MGLGVLVGHPTSNQNFRNIVDALIRAEFLVRVVTCINSSGVIICLGPFLPMEGLNELSRRSFSNSWIGLIESHPLMETMRLVSQRLGWRWLYAKPESVFSFYSVCINFDGWMARRIKAQDIVYAYEYCALETFNRAEKSGVARVYDLPIAYWETGRRLMIEEARRLPSWAATLGEGGKDSPALQARKTRELELADMVVTPSQFVADSLPDWARASKRVVVAPFGSPPVTSNAQHPTSNVQTNRGNFACCLPARWGSARDSAICLRRCVCSSAMISSWL